MKQSLITLAALVICLGSIANARAALVDGTVSDTSGAPVVGVRIRAVNSSGRTAGQGISGADGRYAIDRLPNGQYVFKLDPLATGFQAGDSVAYLTEKGLTIDWEVSLSAAALDSAAIGTAAGSAFAGGSSLSAAAVVSGVVVAGAISGLAAGGIVGGSNAPTGPPASPAL